MRIRIDQEKCSGCHLCEMACSLSHLGVINIEKSAIRILKDDLNTSLNIPVVCNRCKEMKCLYGEDVPEDREKEKFVWPEVRGRRCPFKALTVFGENAYHCDLCAGNPICVKVCTPGAISI